MISRTRSPSFGDYFRYIKGENPCDVWEFEIDGLRGKIVNEWRHGAKLFVGEAIVDQNKTLLEISGKMPMLTASVIDDAGITRKVEVFFRAVFRVKARVNIDGRPIVNAFI